MVIDVGKFYFIKDTFFEIVYVANTYSTFLIQNMFPITSKYIDHIDTVQGKALQVPSETRRIILDKVNKIFKLKKKGVNLIFPDVDRIEKLLIEELNQK